MHELQWEYENDLQICCYTRFPKILFFIAHPRSRISWKEAVCDIKNESDVRNERIGCIHGQIKRASDGLKKGRGGEGTAGMLTRGMNDSGLDSDKKGDANTNRRRVGRERTIDVIA